MQPECTEQGLMAAGIVEARLMSVIVQLKNECGHKLTLDRAVRVPMLIGTVAQVLDATFIINRLPTGRLKR